MNVREAAVELRWFFTEAEGELGLRAMSLEPSGHVEGAAAADRQTRAAVRWTEVSRRLEVISKEHGRVLRKSYGPKPRAWPIGLERWYELAGIAADIRGDGDDIRGARLMLKLSTTDAEGLRKQVKSMLKNALAAFVDAR